ncbi:MAG: MBL fold metallo-hydrolase [Saprospiraceae bacterium]|nr:MBL fold metallo-hydrolase [Saprospiraceae bacterium]
MKIKFCGAAQEVTGSAHHLLINDSFSVLLDCGLFQGIDEAEALNRKWGFEPKDLDCLILSHAHIDHCGRIPKLVKEGFRGKIYCTPATRSLATILLLDSAKIQENDAEYENKKLAKRKHGEFEKVQPLYTISDVLKCLNLFITISYESVYKVNKYLSLKFRDAGHILGSASVFLNIHENDKNFSLVFSGDLGRPNRPILRDPIPLDPADYVICESTYGDKIHQSAPNELEKFLHIVNETCIQNHGKLIIPAFSVGRTQEIVYMLNQLSNKGLLPNIPVYVDSPLAIDATQIFTEHPECYDEEILEYLISDPNPFGFKNLHLIKDVEGSKRLNTDKNPCIIISASGMGNAGRVKHHLYNSLSNPKNTVLIVGYCSPNTPGGQLRAGVSSIFLFGDEIPVRAKIDTMDSFSAHGDQKEMLGALKSNLSSHKKMFLVHGELDTQKAYKIFLQENGFHDIEIPHLYQSFVI